MKKVLLLGVLVALLCGCNTASTQNTTDVKDNLVTPTDETTVRYLDALPADFNEDDMFGLILDYGGYSMIVNAWRMPDGDWLIPYHWCEAEDGGIYKMDEDGNEIEIEYKDPFEGQPYPVIHNPQFSFSTRNYGNQPLHFYAESSGDSIVYTIDFECSLDVIDADPITRRVLCQTNPNDWMWGEPKDEDEKEWKRPYVFLKGWVDEEWICANLLTTCP